MLLDNAFAIEVQANGGATNACSGGPGASFMPKLGSLPFGGEKAVDSVVHEAVRNPVGLAPKPFEPKTEAFGDGPTSSIVDTALHFHAMDAFMLKQVCHGGSRSPGRDPASKGGLTEPVPDFGIAILTVDVPDDYTADERALVPDAAVETVGTLALIQELRNEGSGIRERLHP
jgi:hypothetical protein